MLVYIIDGFNLVHKVGSLKNSSEPHLGLIHYIKTNKFTGSRNNKVIIAFDGGVNYQAQRESEFEIIFSVGVSADEVIKRKVDSIKNKSQIIVVTDDREIRDYVKSAGASIVRVSDFITKKSKDKSPDTSADSDKNISYSLQKEITDEMRKIWDK
ncbi:MAG: NYN domain-containing protein [Candidatus Omnitrophota bacterium]|nr:NYN domain-containing protein [Candidatus Omnitrophota bacterium]